jgi:protein TonB
MAIVVKHPSIFVYGTPEEKSAKRFFGFSLIFHVIFVCAFFLVPGNKSLLELLQSGEVMEVAPQDDTVKQELTLEEIPPPPVVEIPDFVKPEDVAEKKPEPPKPKPIPTPVPVVPHAVTPSGPPKYAATKPVVGNSDFPKPLYPYEAKKRRIQGTVTLLINWDSSGAVVDATVSQGSGYGILDTNARDWVRKHWFFGHASPGRSGSAEVPVRYELMTN